MKLPTYEELQGLSVHNLEKYLDYIPVHFLKDPGIEPYKLCIWLSSQFKTIADLGTYQGLSALALSYSKETKVTSYDITQSSNLVSNRKNITFIEGSIFDHVDEIIKNELIYLDIDPHDGLKEEKLMQCLLDANYKGVVVADDIKLHRYPRMVEWWKSIDEDIKKDITNLGHYSGTGIIYFR